MDTLDPTPKSGGYNLQPLSGFTNNAVTDLLQLIKITVNKLICGCCFYGLLKRHCQKTLPFDTAINEWQCQKTLPLIDAQQN